MPEQQDHGGEAAWLGVSDWGLRWKLWEGMSWPWKTEWRARKRVVQGEASETWPQRSRKTPQGNWKGGRRGGHSWASMASMEEGAGMREGGESSFQTPSHAPNPGSWPWGGSGREWAGDGVGELSLACLLTFRMALSKPECRRAAHLFLQTCVSVPFPSSWDCVSDLIFLS